MSNFKEILEMHKKWLDGDEGGERADLLDANLTRADLTNADLARAYLTHANLRGAHLTRANLTNAYLASADLTHANLRGADLTRANLTNANLTNADLTGADLTRANLRGCIGNRNQIKSLFVVGEYPITYTAEILQIGCKRYPIAHWWGFNDDRIAAMDDGALQFWGKYKSVIRQVIELCPADPTRKEETEDK